MRGREGRQRQRCGGGTPPRPAPHTLASPHWRCSDQDPADDHRTTSTGGACAGDHEVHLLGDGDRVVADALVVTRRRAPAARPATSTASSRVLAPEDVAEQAPFELVHRLVHVGERGRPRTIAVGEGVDRHAELHRRLATHPLDDPTRRRVERMTAEAPRGLGDVDHEVGAALELVGDPERARDEPDVSGARGRPSPRSAQALVLDGVAHRVDVVVVVDDLLGAGEVGRRSGHRCRPRSRSS